VHPIEYSLILNIVTLVVCGILAWTFAQPWLIIVAVVLQTHAIQRFGRESDENDEDDESQPMGFTADVK